MNATLNTPFNETQWYLLSLFEHTQTKSQLNKLKMAICEFYFNEAEKEISRACKEKNISASDVDDFAAQNLHTPYK